MGTTQPPNEELRKKFLNKIEPSNVRSTLEFAALFQMVHEQIKKLVLEDIKSFYGYMVGFNDPWINEDAEKRYQDEVLSKHKSKFTASLLWLQDLEAITEDDSRKLEEIFQHRHSVTHELMRYIIDPDSDVNVELLSEGLKILKKLSLFWNDVEIGIQQGINPEFDGVSAEDIYPGYIIAVQICLDAFLEGLDSPEAKFSS